MSSTEAETSANRPILGTPRAAKMVGRMTERLGLWETDHDAALFLAALALHQGKEPVPKDELDEEREELGDLTAAVESIDHTGELALFKVLLGQPQADLGDVLDANLPGLIEAGCAILEDEMAPGRPTMAIADVHKLVRA